MICVATVQNREEDTHLGCYVVDVSRSAKEGFFCFLVRDWKGVCRKLLSLVFLNFQLLAKMLNFIFIEVTWKLGYLRWLNFVQENWLRGHTSCLHWKWLICFRIWCQTFPPKMWVLRFQDLQFLWLIGHSWSPKIKYCMSGKHSVNLSISAGGLNLLPNLQGLNHWAIQLFSTWNQAGKSCILFI